MYCYCSFLYVFSLGFIKFLPVGLCRVFLSKDAIYMLSLSLSLSLSLALSLSLSLAIYIYIYISRVKCWQVNLVLHSFQNIIRCFSTQIVMITDNVIILHTPLKCTVALSLRNFGREMAIETLETLSNLTDGQIGQIIQTLLTVSENLSLSLSLSLPLSHTHTYLLVCYSVNYWFLRYFMFVFVDCWNTVNYELDQIDT